MASCMTHHCRDCDHEWADCIHRPVCAKCGSLNVAHYFDEELYEEHEEFDYSDNDPDVTGWD